MKAKLFPAALPRLSACGAALMVCLAATLLSACEDNADDTDNSEFTYNWAERNAAYFDSVMAVAKAEVSAAREAYGDAWEEHCLWRVYLSYAKQAGGVPHDSICAKVIERGTGAGYPLYTDSVKVNYMGRLIPTASYPAGRVFDHSGLYATEDYVFSPHFSLPARLLVSNTIEGYTTAVMRMRVGDRWMVYIPQELGYAATSASVIPAYSTLCFDIQLKGFYRRGESTY